MTVHRAGRSQGALTAWSPSEDPAKHARGARVLSEAQQCPKVAVVLARLVGLDVIDEREGTSRYLWTYATNAAGELEISGHGRDLR